MSFDPIDELAARLLRTGTAAVLDAQPNPLTALLMAEVAPLPHAQLVRLTQRLVFRGATYAAALDKHDRPTRRQIEGG